MAKNGDRGLQVVDVVGANTYSLSEEALGVLLQDGVRDLPVAVISVAGAFRGGKSFLLDFFLRYLNATDAERKSDAWLGGEQDPLVGFGWRTGAARNTIGIHIWSRPFQATLPSGEKVAVVLMDTQGTFDNESSMGVCTTIFGLSTLLSSVQIYNLSSNLKSDDFQHLQLFTEYARLVLSDSGQPFQHLKFLIRDWMFTSDQPIGAEGGKRLLETVLQVKPEQPAQQQEIRRHLRSCFEDIDCFLMAHPGFAVSDANFKGRLADLRAEFRACLLEFTPLVLAPARLVPKRVAGQRVTAGELATYFRTYMAAFNSGDLPTPTTILQATSEAALLLATEAARAQYSRDMAAGGAGGELLQTAELYGLHDDALAKVRQLFASRKIMGDRRKIDDAVAKVIQELNSHLADFIKVNDAKMSEAIKGAMEHYVTLVFGDIPEARLCAGPAPLDAAHQAAAAAAAYAIKDQLHAHGEDNITPQLLKDINARYLQIVRTNELNNEEHLGAALARYITAMEAYACIQPCTSSDKLHATHLSAYEQAKNFLTDKRNRFTDSDTFEDCYFQRLNKDVNAQYNKFEQLSKTNIEAHVVRVIAFYKDSMGLVFGPQMKCVVPGNLKKEEEGVRRDAVKMYHDKTADEVGLTKINEVMNMHYRQLVETNDELNRAAVDAGSTVYRCMMDAKTQSMPTLRPLMFLMAPFRLIALVLDLKSFHEEASSRAIDTFKTHRRSGSVDSDAAVDPYYDRLKTDISNQYEGYKNPFIVIARDLGINV